MPVYECLTAEINGRLLPPRHKGTKKTEELKQKVTEATEKVGMDLC
jgi:hypothetical protein